MKNIKNYSNAGILLGIAIFITDALMPLGIASGFLYIAPLLLLATSQRIQTVKFSGVLFSLLILVGIIPSESGLLGSDFIWWANRALSLIMILFSTYVLIFIIKKIEELDKQRVLLDDVLSNTDTILIEIDKESKKYKLVTKGDDSAVISNLSEWREIVGLEKVLGKKNSSLLLELLTKQPASTFFDWCSDVLTVRLGEPWVRATGIKTDDLKCHAVIQVIWSSKRFEMPITSINSLIDTIPCLIWTIDKDGLVSNVNKLAKELLSKVDKASSAHWKELIDPIDASQIIERFKQNSNQNVIESFDFKLRCGETVTEVTSRLIPFYDEHGQIQKIIGFGLDVTSFKQLLTAQSIWTELANSAQTPSCICKIQENNNKQELTITFANAAFLQLTKYEETEVTGQNLINLFNNEPTDIPVNIESIISVNDVNEGKDFSIICKDGQLKFVELFANKVDSNFVIVNFKNITQRVELKDVSERNKRMDSIGHLTGGIAHDFNNFLAIIAGNLELAKLQDLNSEAKRFVNTAEEAANQAAKLTSSMLHFARGDELHKHPINLENFFSSQKFVLESLLENKGKIVVDVDPRFNILFDVAQLESIMTNLVSNAVYAASKERGLRISITAKYRKIDIAEAAALDISSEEYVQLVVTDNGEGIPYSEIGDVFSPFFSTKPKSKGTGLGLSLLYTYMKHAAGAVTVDSTVNVGTSFKLLFKQSTDNPFEHLTYENKRTSKLSRNTLNGKVALILEDKPRLAEIAQMHFTELGFETHIYKSGEALLDKIPLRREPDLVFSDISMPGMNGYELVDELRKAYPKVNVIYVSGLFDEDHIKLKAKGSQSIKKPYTVRQLLAAIDELYFKKDNVLEKKGGG